MTVKIVDFYADWCGPCKQLEPVLEEVAEENNIDIVKVDVERDPSEQDSAEASEYSPQELGVRSLPTVMFVETSGEPGNDYSFDVEKQLIGNQSKQSLEKAFGEIRA